MKKIIGIILLIIGIGTIVSSCNVAKHDTNKDISCTITKQYKDKYGYNYYIEGTCNNTSDLDYSYLQIEFICYDKNGYNLGTAFDNTNNLLKGQTWKYKAFGLFTDAKNVDHCSFHETTGW